LATWDSAVQTLVYHQLAESERPLGKLDRKIDAVFADMGLQPLE
jgi:hypothetical protein